MKKRIVVCGLFIVVAASMAATLVFHSRHLPSFLSVREGFKASDLAVLDRNGQVIGEERIDPRVRRLSWVALNNIPPSFLEAILRAEDKRFYHHPGFDPIALAQVIMARVVGHTDRGASTITMQVTELMDAAKKRHYGRRTIPQKIIQIYQAMALELIWTKAEILEAYINLVHYRSELQGVAAASFGLFDKAPMALLRPEAAVLAALIRSPNAEATRVQTRACWLLSELGAPDECSTLTHEHLASLENGYRIRPYARLAPHVTKRLATTTAGGKTGIIKTTLDRDLQFVAIHALQKQITAMQNQNMNDGGVIVIENTTGNVLAYVGNIGSASKAPYVDAVTSRRQAGSTLKPLIYAKAIDSRILTAATVLEDSPLAISVAAGVYRPSNFDRAFRSLVTVRTALASSLNIPAVRALELIGVETFVQTLNDLGFTGLERSEFYGPSLALGAADVRLIELANAYRTIANNGEWTPVRFSPDIAPAGEPHRVFSPEASFIIKSILSDREARVATFGMESTLSTRFWTAVKTGTSKDMRDNWTVGFSDKYTVGVWTGNFSGESMWNVSGVQGAAPVWQEVINYLHERESSTTPSAPEGVVEHEITYAHDGSSRREWFIAGTQPSTNSVEAKPEVRSHIVYPLSDSLVALDPDIPMQNQRLFIQVAAPQPGQVLCLNGKRLAAAKPALPWEPRAGRYVLELKDADGNSVDRVIFEVRGRHSKVAQR